MNNSTRAHYRNSTLAFPKTAAYGCAIERPAPRIADHAVTVFLWLAVVAIVLSICFQGVAK